MLDLLFNQPLVFAIGFFSILVAITVHEAAHAYTADYLGDPTPRSQGRLSLNPLSHLDPLGTAMLLLFRFGWGKPVQFDPFNLKNPRTDAAVISLAGPASNLLLAAVAALIYRLFGSDFVFPLYLIFISINVGLAIFNLVPVHPLDGAKIVMGLLPRDMAYEFESISNQYGRYILLLLILPIANSVSPIIRLINPVIQAIINLLL